MFFAYKQNNVRGKWIGPAIMAFVEAESPIAANEVLEKENYNFSDYCSCCGSRWMALNEDADGADEPYVYGTPLVEWWQWAESKRYKQIAKNISCPVAIVYYANGRKKIYSPDDLS